MKTRIICVGSSFIEEDSIGGKVFDLLTAAGLPDGVSVADGGLAGMDNFILMKDVDRVVFADAVRGFGEQGDIVVLNRQEVASLADGFGHSAGLPYLFYMAEHVLEYVPEMLLVGSEKGMSDTAEMAAVCLEVAINGLS